MSEIKGYYDVAQICLNGHVVNDSTQSSPGRSGKHCPDCGKATITQCPDCNEPIKGRYHYPGFFKKEKMPAPSYCTGCGAPYPWTTAILEAAKDLVAEEEILSQDEIQKFSESLPDLISETPRTTLSATRVKRIVDKMSAVGKEGFKQLLFEITIESAKHLIWPK